MSQPAKPLDVPRPWRWVVLLALVVFAIYAPSLSNGFTLDDPHVVRAVRPDGDPNPMTGGVRPIADAREPAHIRDAA